MLRWYAIYRDAPQKEFCTEEHGAKVAVLKRFDYASQLGMHGGRAVIAMWLVDTEGEQPEGVIAVYGRVPLPVEDLHQVYLREKEKPRR
jgi:hypothetical protein